MPVLRPRASNVHLPALAVPFAGQRLLARLDRYPVEHRVRATIALCWADPSRVHGERFAEAIEEASRRARLAHEGEAMLGSLRSLIGAYLRPLRFPLWRLAATVRTPTLLVYGLKDRLVDPRTAGRALRTFPRARLVVLPDSGHVSQMEHPAVVADEVRRLVDSSGNGSRSRP
jgi:pimeloyl-ACP methyl ester carboxylesterase